MNEIPREIQKKIQAAKKNSLIVLDLSVDPDAPDAEKLAQVPQQVFELVQLEELHLGGHRIASLPEAIGELRNLRVLNLRWNELVSIPASIGRLSNLVDLDLDLNDYIELPDSLGELQGLKTLALGTVRGMTVPPWLSQLQSLESLKISLHTAQETFPEEVRTLRRLRDLTIIRMQMHAVPDWIGELKNLQSLSLEGNQLSSLPEAISKLRDLALLDLSDNSFEQLPSVVLNLVSLQSLSFDNNPIHELPEDIGNLANLRLLSLSQTQLSSLPESIGNLQRLEVLNLAGARFTEIPGSVHNLYSLKRLSFGNYDNGPGGNRIRKVSSRILSMPELQSIDLFGNLVEVPPLEIVGRGLDAIREYFRQLEAQGTDYLYEAKLIIVGEGGAGKTTLAKKLQDPEYVLKDEESTAGIDVAYWRFPLPNGRTFQANIWDFGGQEIYHATHQFFLTRRSLYALVADTRKEDTDFHYWLSIVELLSDRSPLLIIKNEKKDRHREINERALRGQFGGLKDALAANFATNRGVGEIRDEIQHRIAHLPHIGSPLPKRWVEVRKALEGDPRNYISLDEFFELCGRFGFDARRDKLQLSGYLHDLGVILHFHDDPILKKAVILKPKWGTDAVYKVLDNRNVINQQGRFTRHDLENIWAGDEYANMLDELLQLMMRFGLCYPVPGSKNRYIAPQRLTENQPEYPWDETDNLILRYTYEFMPKGIVTQVIVAMNPLIEGQRLVWKTGVVLEKERTRAEVVEHYGKRELQIRVAGAHKKDLLTLVVYEMDRIHSTYTQLKYNKLIPCNCGICKPSQEPNFYPFETLRRFVADRRTEIQCQKSYEMVDVFSLVDDIGAREQLLKGEIPEGKVPYEGTPVPGTQFHGPVERVVVMAPHTAIHQEETVNRPSPKPARVQSAWANGSFYLFAVVIVLAALGVLAENVSPFVLPLLLIAGVILVPLLGALQLKMDERLSDKSFLDLVRMSLSQLPLIGKAVRRTEKIEE